MGAVPLERSPRRDGDRLGLYSGLQLGGSKLSVSVHHFRNRQSITTTNAAFETDLKQ
jgi:hypothetical protein